MAFVRTKTIKGAKYAYLVENTWGAKGARQKVLKYLGKTLPIPSGHVDADIGQLTYAEAATQLVQLTLERAGFTGAPLSRDGVTVDLVTGDVIRNGKRVTLASNEGFLCAETIRQLRDPPPGTHGEIAHALATKVLEAGVKVGPDTFAQLFDKVKPKEEPAKEFYY